MSSRDERTIAAEAARLSAVDAEALCKALGVTATDRLQSVEMIEFMMQRFHAHHARLIAQPKT
jgi:hypothetical protein